MVISHNIRRFSKIEVSFDDVISNDQRIVGVAGRIEQVRVMAAERFLF